MKHERLKKLLDEFQRTGDAQKIYDLFDALQIHHVEQTFQSTPREPKENQEHTSYNATVKLDPKEKKVEDDTHTVAHYSSQSQEQSYEAPLPFRSLNTHYEQEKILGQGGMGVVWRVRDSNLNRTMALKMLNDQHSMDVTIQEEFMEEAQISAQLQHPGIIPVYELNHLPTGQLFFTMKEVQGRTLKEVIKTVHQASEEGTWGAAKDGWNLRRLIHAFHMICETIAYAHSRGVIHRDLKPQNIMIGDFGEVLVVDWGIAKILPSEGYSPNEEYIVTHRSRLGFAEAEGTVLGSPAYMSPEQAWGDTDSIRETSDIYSLGMILCEILIGKVPYKGSAYEILDYKRKVHTLSLRGLETPEKEALRKEKKDFDFLDKAQEIMSLDPSLPLPNELIDICEKALQYDAHMRYSTVLELAEDIQSWLDGAQRREKALSIVAKAKALEEQIVQKRREALSHWKNAELHIREDMQSSKGWSLWETSKKINEVIEEQEEEMLQLLHGAMMYDPELIDIHKRLIQVEYKGYLDAALRGDKKIKRKIQRRISIHLEHLSKEESLYWREREKKDMGSLHVLQKKKGTFVGREVQKKEVRSLIEKHRLLSLVGTAGVGKTHLTLEVAAQWKTEQQHDVIFCDITTANNALCIVQIIAESLNIDVCTENPLEQIESVLHERGSTLLIFDNTEHLVHIASHLIEHLLKNVPTLHIMVTSRVKLAIPQEKVYQLHPMSVLEGVELFVQQAQRALPDFHLSLQNRETIGTIVQRLDSLPLAIELAASRISMLSVEDIATRLSQRFALLRGRMRDPQQLALQGALDWSWDLLSEVEQYALVQCGIFHGGFDIIAAEHIIRFQNQEEPINIIDIMEALYDDHLLIKNKLANGRFRYGMLASIREYVVEKLSLDAFKHLQETTLHHAQYYGQLAQSMKQNPELSIDQDLDNLVAGVQNGRPNDAFLCCQGFMEYILLHGPMDRGIELSNMFLSRNDLHDDLRIPIQLHRITCLRIAGKIQQAKNEISAIEQYQEEQKKSKTQERKAINLFAHDSTHATSKLSFERGVLEREQSNYQQAIEEFSNLLVQYRSYGNQIEEAKTLREIGRVHREKGELDTSLQYYKEGLRLCIRTENNTTKGIILGEMGVLYSKIGKIQKSEEYYTQSIEVTRETGDKKQEGINLGNLGTLYLRLCQYEKAMECLEQSVHIAQKVGNKRNEGINLGNLGTVYRNTGTYETSIEYFKKSLAIAKEVGNKKNENMQYVNLGGAYLTIGQYDESIRLFHKSIRISEEMEQHMLANVTLSNLGSAYRRQGKYIEAMKCFQKAILVSRKIKHIRGEGINLGNLGIVLYKIDAYEEAKTYLIKAIDICLTQMKIGAGAFQGILALIYAKQHDFETAFALLQKGERNVSKNPEEYGKFLCAKAEVLFLNKQLQSSKEALEQARTIQNDLKLHKGSDLAQTIEAVQRMYLANGTAIEANIHLEQANIELNQCNYEKAMTLFQLSLQLFQYSNDQIGEVTALQGIGRIYREQGEAQKSMEVYQKAHTITTNLNNPREEGKILGELGTASFLMNDCKTSIIYYNDAITLAQQIGDKRMEGVHIGNIGSVYQDLGKYEAAITSFKCSIDIAQEIGDKRTECVITGELGSLYRYLGEYTKAISHYRTALSIASSQGDKRTEGVMHGNIGLILKNQDRYEEAISAFTKALTIAQEIGDQRNESIVLNNLGIACKSLAQYDKAVEYYTKSIKIAIRTKDRASEALGLTNLGNIYQTQHKYDMAIHHYQKTLTILHETGQQKDKGVILGNLGDALFHHGHYEEAKVRLQQAIDLCDQTMPVGAGVFRGSLALLLAMEQNFIQAFTVLSQGEEQVKIYKKEYGKFLCKKAEIFLLNGDTYQAREALHAARSTMKTIVKGSVLANMIQAVQEKIDRL